MRRYIEGRYFKSDKDIEALRNAPDRWVLDKFRDVFPKANTKRGILTHLETDSNISRGESKETINKTVNARRESHFVHELNKDQKKVYLSKNDTRDTMKKVEDRAQSRPPPATSGLFVVEEVDNTLINEEYFTHYQLAPGYVKYTQDLIDAWNYAFVNKPDVQENLDDISIKLIQILRSISQSPEMMKIVTNRHSEFAKIYCENCGTNYEARDFLHAILLRVLDQFENSDRYIEFLKDQKVVNGLGYDHYVNAEMKSKKLTRSYRDDNNRKASHRNLSKVRVIATNEYIGKIYFLALKRDSSFITGTAGKNLEVKGITEDSLIEYNRKEQYFDSHEVPFAYRIDHIDSNNPYVRELEDDGSIPRIKDTIKTDIKELKVEDKLYYVRGQVVRCLSPNDERGVDEVGDVDTGVIEIQDRTGKIPYIKMPYDSGWRKETIRIGTWVEIIGIFKSSTSEPGTGDTLIDTPSLYAPYKVEFFRPFKL
jgi:hypothetical protein